MKRRGVIYTRVSTGPQAEGTSLELQELACRRKADSEGIDVVGVFSDPGESGAFYLTRPGIQQALALIEEGAANVLLIYKLDRTARDLQILLDIRDRVAKARGECLFADGASFPHNPTGNMLFAVSGAVAQFDKDNIRERLHNGRKMKADKGIQVARNFAPFGYHIVTRSDVIRGAYPQEAEGRYIVVDEEARWIRLVFNRYVNGESLRAICRWLEENGVKTPRGASKWQAESVRFILQNSVYRGEATYGRTEHCTDERRVEKGWKRTYHKKREGAGCILIPVDPLVSAGVWAAAQVRLQENRDRMSGPKGRRYLLAGLLRCPCCDQTMKSHKQDRVHGGNIYECRLHKASVKASAIEEKVLEALVDFAAQPELMENCWKEQVKADSQEEVVAQLATVRQEWERVVQKERVVADAKIDALLKSQSISPFDDMLTQLAARRRTLEVQVKQLEMQVGERKETSREGHNPAEEMRQMLAALESKLRDAAIPAGVKNGWLAMIVDSIRYTPLPKGRVRRVEIVMRGQISLPLDRELVLIYCDRLDIQIRTKRAETGSICQEQ